MVMLCSLDNVLWIMVLQELTSSLIGYVAGSPIIRLFTEIVEIRAEDGIGGVCTSGLGGRSLTRGIAGGVTVFSRRCALADACATHIANCSYIESPRVHTCLAGEIEPESDIASLRIVTAVEPLLQEEKRRGLMQVYEETERQWKNGNLVRVYADIQGERLTFERSAQ